VLLSEIGSDIFFSNSESSTPSSSDAKSLTDNKALRDNDSDSDADDVHGIRRDYCNKQFLMPCLMSDCDQYCIMQIITAFWAISMV